MTGFYETSTVRPQTCERVRTRESLEINRVWVVSTAHITSDDAKLLSAVKAALCCYEYPEGFWILVPDAYQPEFLDELSECGLSRAVGHILSVAQKHLVTWVRLDADGPIYDFLPQYHW